MNTRLPRITVVGGVLFATSAAGLSMEMETVTITMEQIDAIIAKEEFMKEPTYKEGDHHKLQEDDQCWHGGQSNQNLSWLGRSWGSCQDLDPCVCGLQPRRMAYWCPELCRPSCGGSCATPSDCPNGFNVEDGQTVPYFGSPDPELYPSFWPANWGTECEWYDNPGAPGATPAPTPSPVASGQQCGQLNTVCSNMACCSGLSCGAALSDGNRYCGSAAPGSTPAPASAPTLPSPTSSGAPTLPSPTSSGNGEQCGQVNTVCNDAPCCSGLSCGTAFSDGNRYCGQSSSTAYVHLLSLPLILVLSSFFYCLIHIYY